MYSTFLIALFIIFSILSAFVSFASIYEREYKQAVLSLVILGINLTCLGYEFFKPYWQIKNREIYYANLVVASNNIKSPYAKTEIDKVIKAINNSNKKEKVIIDMPNDFYSLNRKKEYNEVIKTIKSSGFRIEVEIEECIKILFTNECHKTTKIEVW